MRLLFVCTGNANRSALAEAVMRKIIPDSRVDDIVVASCGTKVPAGLQRDELMCRIAHEHGYDMEGASIPMTEDLLNSADIIIVMTEHQRNEVTRVLVYSHWDRIVLFNNYCFGVKNDLADPYFQSIAVYENCFKTIEQGCKEIIKKLTKDK